MKIFGSVGGQPAQVHLICKCFATSIKPCSVGVIAFEHLLSERDFAALREVSEFCVTVGKLL